MTTRLTDGRFNKNFPFRFHFEFFDAVSLIRTRRRKHIFVVLFVIVIDWLYLLFTTQKLNHKNWGKLSFSEWFSSVSRQFRRIPIRFEERMKKWGGWVKDEGKSINIFLCKLMLTSDDANIKIRLMFVDDWIKSDILKTFFIVTLIASIIWKSHNFIDMPKCLLVSILFFKCFSSRWRQFHQIFCVILTLRWLTFYVYYSATFAAAPSTYLYIVSFSFIIHSERHNRRAHFP